MKWLSSFVANLLLLFAALVLAAFPIALAPTRSLAASNCSIPGVRFATCDPNVRHFKSVMVAIPGWNGICADSFGVAESNLLNLMRRANFFDVDCFDYDSHNTPLDQSATQLRDFLIELQDMGYREVAFVTHSTGGVLALHLLLRELMNTDATAVRTGDQRSFLFQNRDGLKLVAFYAWGIPISGVRQHICEAGRLGNLFGVSRAVLPLLCADSTYLGELKARYGQFNALYSALPLTEQSGFRFNFYVLQGQGEDWVVNDIVPNSPWFPANGDTRTVNTLSGHTTVVKANGTIEFPTFAGETMTDKSQLYFSLAPRTDVYFREDATATTTLDEAQKAILSGVVDFASVRNLFTAGSGQVSDFTVMLFNGRFVRGPDFDGFAVDQLDGLLRWKVDALAKPDAVHYGDSLLDDIADGYRSPNPTDPALFGGQSRVAVRKLASTVGYVFETVHRLVYEDPTLSRELDSSLDSLTEFDVKATQVLERLLAEDDAETLSQTLSALQQLAAAASVAALEQVDVADVFDAFTSANYTTLTEDQKVQLGDVLTTFAGRSTKSRTDVLKLLTVPKSWLGKEVPMWVPLLNDEQLKRLIDGNGRADALTPQFLGQVIENAGSFGQSYVLAKDAIKRYEPYLAGPASPDVDRNRAIFVDSISATAYPAVRNEGARLLMSTTISE